MLLLTLAAMLQAAEPPRAVPGTIKTFRDWVVGCDNGKTCKAVSLGPDHGDFPRVVIAVEREAGPTGDIRLHFSGEADYRGPVVILVDGRQVARGGTIVDGELTLDGAGAVSAARALATGTLAEVRSDGRSLGRVSLAGVSAALRYIDAEQSRAGTTTALIATGGVSPENVPTPAIPSIRRARPSGSPVRLTPALVRQMQEMAACGPRAREMFNDIKPHALGAARTLVVLPCQLGAYNSVEAIFVIEDDKPHPARFDTDVMMSDNDRVPSLINSDYVDGVLGGFGKGRGLGDCGVREGYVWDEMRFRLIDKAEMPECRGTRELIVTWRATAR